MKHLSEELHRFLLEGYCLGNISEHLEYFKDKTFPHCHLIEENGSLIEINSESDLSLQDQFLEEALKVKRILEDHIQIFFEIYEIHRICAWQNYSPEVDVFHDDREAIPNKLINSAILIYIDEDNEERGNFLEILNEKADCLTKGTKRIYPKFGDFIWMNESGGFKHRAVQGSNNQRRRIFAVEMLIPSLER